MHRSNREVAFLDPEIERTLRRQRRNTPHQKEQEIWQPIEEILIELPFEEEMAENDPNRRILRDFALPGTQDSQTSIVRPTVNANNFEIKPSLIQMVQQSQYGGNATEYPNSHLSTFLEICDIIKFNGVSDDAIKLRLFPYSLRDKAKVWLQSHPPNTFTTWAELTKAFLNKFFPPGKTAKLRMDITSFSQQEGETLYEPWERYRELQRRCPHHGLPDWLVVQTFYNGLTYPTKTHVDAAAGGALMGKITREAQQLIEEMATNNYQWANERGKTRRTAGMLEVDTLNMLSAKMDNVVKMLNRHVGSSSNQGVVVACCTTCGGDRDDSMCFSSEQVQYLNNYNRPPQNNPYSNTYNPGWRNHPNFGWKDQGNQQRPVNPPGFQPKQSLPESKPTWELAIEKLANVSNDKIEKLASATTQRFKRIEGRMNQLTNIYRNVEVQLGQIANAVKNRNQGDLPSKTEIPSYAKFLNEIMTKKRRLVDSETIALTEECSAIIQNKLPPKLKDPGSFTVPCTIGNVEFSKALCDLGASVSLIPLTVTRQLGLKELKHTNIFLQLADRS
ncbi:uncharacterized protein [Coffea arabica]|uniref:Retrotransposon gag domain-containing protein n=1 Tax=Coffea arabica TaxID=13443 RepID=A0ABM4VBZ0_COFAR